MPLHGELLVGVPADVKWPRRLRKTGAIQAGASDQMIGRAGMFLVVVVPPGFVFVEYVIVVFVVTVVFVATEQLPATW